MELVVAPGVGDEFVVTGDERAAAEDMVYLKEAVETLVGASEREVGIGITEVGAEATIGIARTGVIEVTYHDGGIGRGLDIRHEVIGLLVPQDGLIEELTEGMLRVVTVIGKSCGLEMDIEEADGIGSKNDIGEELLVIGVRIIAFGHARQRITADDGEVKDFIFTAVADGIGVIGERCFDAVPPEEVVMGALLEADDISLPVMGKGCELMKGLGAELEVVNVEAY